MKQIKKIALITPDYPPNVIGGCGISSSLLVNQLRGMGNFVDVYCFNIRQETIKSENGSNYYFNGFSKIPFLNNVIAFFHLWHRLGHYNIVHVYNMDLIPVAALIKRGRYKLVATINNPKGALPSTYTGQISIKNRINDYLTTSLIKIFKNKVDKYIALTQALKELYISHGYDDSTISIVPNMYDPLFLAPAANVRDKKGITLLYSGQLGDNKGVLDLIEAFVIMTKKYPNIHLKILGKGKHKDRIADYLKAHDLEKRATLTYKPYPEVRDEYFSSDILIHPAKWFEPFSRVWLEAMSANLIIVSTNNPSAREVLKDRALFYNPGNQNELIQTIEKAIKMAQCGNVTYPGLGKYSPETVVGSIINIYQQ